MERNGRTGVRPVLILMLGAAVCLGIDTPAEAYYASDDLNSDTEILDYIENARRKEREERLSEEQIQLVRDAQEMQSRIKGPVDPTRLPVAIEGDDMFYDEATGEVYAKGSVRITELDARRFKSDEARGNLKEQEIRVDGKAHMIQMTPGAPHADLDGYRAIYNYGKRPGR